MVRQVVSEILVKDGHTVRAAATFGEAQELVRTFKPHVLLTNLFLRDKTGHAAAKELRSECPDMRVLMVTGVPDDERLEKRTADDEFYEVFPKPFSPRELTAKVRQMLE